MRRPGGYGGRGGAVRGKEKAPGVRRMVPGGVHTHKDTIGECRGRSCPCAASHRPSPHRRSPQDDPVQSSRHAQQLPPELRPARRGSPHPLLQPGGREGPDVAFRSPPRGGGSLSRACFPARGQDALLHVLLFSRRGKETGEFSGLILYRRNFSLRGGDHSHPGRGRKPDRLSPVRQERHREGAEQAASRGSSGHPAPGDVVLGPALLPPGAGFRRQRGNPRLRTGETAPGGHSARGVPLRRRPARNTVFPRLHPEGREGLRGIPGAAGRRDFPVALFPGVSRPGQRRHSSPGERRQLRHHLRQGAGFTALEDRGEVPGRHRHHIPGLSFPRPLRGGIGERRFLRHAWDESRGDHREKPRRHRLSGRLSPVGRSPENDRRHRSQKFPYQAQAKGRLPPPGPGQRHHTAGRLRKGRGGFLIFHRPVGANGHGGAAPGGPERGRGGQPGEERLPGQHEPRDPDANERHPRHDVPRPGNGSLPGAEGAPGDGGRLGKKAHDPAERHTGPLPHRGRKAEPGQGALFPPEDGGPGGEAPVPPGGAEGAVLHSGRGSLPGRQVSRRFPQAEPGAPESLQQRPEVHVPGRCLRGRAP